MIDFYIFITSVGFSCLYLMLGVGVKRLSAGRVMDKKTNRCITKTGFGYILTIVAWPMLLVCVSIMDGSNNEH